MAYPPPRLGKRLLVIFVISLVIFLLVDQFGLLDLNRLLEGLEGEARAQRVRLLLTVLFLPLLPIGLYVIHFGSRILRSGTFPPPGSRLIRPTEPQTGTSAKLRGWLVVVTGLCVCGLAWYGAVVIPNEIARLLTAQ